MAGFERGEPAPRADLAGPARVVQIRRERVADLLLDRPGGTPGRHTPDRSPERAERGSCRRAALTCSLRLRPIAFGGATGSPASRCVSPGRPLGATRQRNLRGE